ncbi:sorting nexin mvp1 [Aaosphaeria arxii CBS 175.79]|uniref:Sorting nexin MVP1 n=1 Tax=Aaosphaeria arxii CBS 175.79 TaxID=1450172 RepID=A0A6A5XEW5_9PLEO|nr:sorting nexin mvp1 [Aaosphaeria arxii CBS 175.79]KAF2011463.1 sorting nexin mvp1 [Aaosphaeria arxii CBS 175.79]
MSLFGDDFEPSQTRSKQSSGLFDDEPQRPANRSSNSLFADDFGGNDDSPWGLPTPKKGKADRGSLVKNLLPASAVPEAYIDAFDGLLEDGDVTLDRVRKIVESSGLPDETQTKIVEILGKKDGSDALDRAEFNVVFALVGLAQEGEDVTLDSVDERKKNLPVPSISIPKPAKQPTQTAEEPASTQARMVPTPPPQQQSPSQQVQTPSRTRPTPRKPSFGDPMADPWGSPDLHRGHTHSSYTSVPPQTNGNHAPSATRTTSQFTTASAATGTTAADSTQQRPSTVGSEGAGWGEYNAESGGGFSGLGGEGFGQSPGAGGGSNNPAGLSRPVGGSRIISNGVEEVITVSTLAEKEGVFMFQHRNYEVTSARRNSKVIRRYSDFVWLLDCLHKRYPFRQLPLLPPKRVAINGNYLAADASFVEKRRKGLARFINALVRHPVLSQEQLVIMFLTVPTELAVWRKQATISVQEEFTGKPLPPDLEDSLPKTLPELFDTVRSGIRRSAEVYINLCNMMERLTKRNEGMAAEFLRFSTALQTLTEASKDTYASDTSDVPMLNEGLSSTARHLEQSRALLEDEARGWEEGVLEDLKRQRDSLVSMRDLFDRRDKYAKDNIPYLEKRISTNEQKLQGIRSKPPHLIKPNEAEKVEEAIFKDKESIVEQHARGVFIRECIRDELLFFQQSQYHVSRLHQDWSQERVKYAELQADNWRALSEEVEGMPLGE